MNEPYIIEQWINLDAQAANDVFKIINGSSSSAADPLVVTQGDAVIHRLRFLHSKTAPATAVDLGAIGIIMAAKSANSTHGTSTLFSALGYTRVVDEADVYYEAFCNFDTDEIATVFTAFSTLSEIDCRVDIEVQNGDNSRRKTFRGACKVQKEVYSGGPLPKSSEPPYPAASAIVTKIRGTVAIPIGETLVEIAGLNLGGAPAQILLTLRKPSAGGAFFNVDWIDGSESADGFQIESTAAPTVAGYKVDYLIIM